MVERLSDQRREATAYCVVGNVRARSNDLVAGQALLERALVLAHELDDPAWAPRPARILPIYMPGWATLTDPARCRSCVQSWPASPSAPMGCARSWRAVSWPQLQYAAGVYLRLVLVLERSAPRASSYIRDPTVVSSPPQPTTIRRSSPSSGPTLHFTMSAPTSMAASCRPWILPQLCRASAQWKTQPAILQHCRSAIHL
jgi:hypothetical protein